MTQTQIDPLAPPLVMPLDLECLDTTVLYVQYWQIPVIFHRESRKKTHFGPLFAQILRGEGEEQTDMTEFIRHRVCP